MPTYEYACDACGHNFEEFQSITADALRQCPACRKRKLRRLIGTGAGVIFKGSGFYQTDYRSESYKKAAEAESKSASGGSTRDTAAKSASSETPAGPASTKAAGDAKPAAAARDSSRSSKKKPARD
ncbi:MAG: hypothetical protein CHACPFDD_02134 [Phycisphaerae bacterium]|nr:hypothetical protein [Phycisphaerae bacterium]